MNFFFPSSTKPADKAPEEVISFEEYSTISVAVIRRLFGRMTHDQKMEHLKDIDSSLQQAKKDNDKDKYNAIKKEAMILIPSHYAFSDAIEVFGATGEFPDLVEEIVANAKKILVLLLKKDDENNMIGIEDAEFTCQALLKHKYGAHARDLLNIMEYGTEDYHLEAAKHVFKDKWDEAKKLLEKE